MGIPNLKLIIATKDEAVALEAKFKKLMAEWNKREAQLKAGKLTAEEYLATVEGYKAEFNSLLKTIDRMKAAFLK